MLGDIGIIVFALIGIFSKKRWAAVVSTIWLITSFIIGFTLNTNTNIYSGEETFQGSILLLVILEIILISIAWVVVVKEKSKNEN